MLAIIPARGGSKGLPGKNIKLLCGKPLIVHTIEAAMACESIDRIILSTDDKEIAQIAGQYDIDIPFMRPKELAQDDSLAIDNYLYTVERLNTECSGNYEEIIALLPTSPLRTAEDIDSAVELFQKKNADSIISCTEMAHPFLWAKKIDKNGKIGNYFDTSIRNKNRQEFKPAYIPNGSIYILKYSLLKKEHTYYSDKTYAYVMPSERSIDIDTELDFRFAEFLIEKGALNA